ncbi:hypothetical protein [Halopenitus persicus]|uniref:Uncharacterized protein n=1 Tax=Halopenitus persicus TaxID=1048396 RepID=A0A1H3MR52_9EURY|nr:hypothetical protein [Halopenitus persicus]SDY78990.1 hypothetical protein SAMN05216564_11047 [Halopenitus persicus]
MTDLDLDADFGSGSGLDDLDVSVVAWGIAGIPLLVTFVQTVLSLLDWTSETLGLRGVLDPIYSIDVVFQAAEVFKDQPSLVAALFVLITIAWVVQGAAMIVLDHRDLAFGAAGLASILYLVLFFGVYSSLFGSGVGAGQLVGFFAIPVIATALVGSAAWIHDWSEEVLEETSGRLGDQEARIGDARERFETVFEQRIGSLDALEPVAPTGVGEAESAADRFHDRCDDLLAEIDRIQRIEDPDRRREEVSKLESRIDSLDPEAEVDRIASELRRRVVSGVRTEFGDVTVRSRYGGAYTLANLPTEYREVSLPPDGDAVRTDDLNGVLQERLDRGVPLPDVGEAIGAAAAHLDRIESFLADHEERADGTIQRVRSRLETVEEQLDRLPESVRSSARGVLVENRVESITGRTAIERTLSDATDALHDCAFDECERLLDRADEESERLVTAAEFLRALDGRVQHGGSSVDIPATVNPDAVAPVAETMAEAHDTTVSVEDDRVRIGDGDDGDGSAFDSPAGATGPTGPGGAAGRTSGGDGTGGNGRGVAGSADHDATDRADRGGAAAEGAAAEDDRDGTAKRPEEVLDAALYFLRELEEHARSTDGSRVQYQIADLPSTIADPDMLRNVERFLRNQSDLIAEVDLQDPEPPAFFEVVVADERQATTAIRTARERFTERYG